MGTVSLITADGRAVAMAETYLHRNRGRLGQVPQAGEVVRISDLGTHALAPQPMVKAQLKKMERKRKLRWRKKLKKLKSQKPRKKLRLQRIKLRRKRKLRRNQPS